MAWPTDLEGWGRHLDLGRATYAGLANAIAEFEPLTMIVNPGEVRSAQRALAGTVDIMEIDFESAWIRDSGPLVVVDETGRRLGVDFGFNGWGERYKCDKTAASTATVLERLGIERVESSLILEGGAISVDGEGTLITTEQCLLNENRNPGWSREAIEAELALMLGIEKVVWLPWGIAADTVTDGHVDAVCTFTAPGEVLLQTCSDAADPDFELMAANRSALAAATDSRGRPFLVFDLPSLPSEPFEGVEIGVAYANVVLVNGGVIAGTGDYPSDLAAVEVLHRAFPDREVVTIPGTMFSYAGGGPHCTTMQIPIGGSR
jgi:agmatine deiminase